MKQQVILSPEGDLGLVMEVNQYAPYFDQHSVLKVKDFSITWFALKMLGVEYFGIPDLWADIGETLDDDIEILGEL